MKLPTIKDFDIVKEIDCCSVVDWKQIEKKLGKRENKRFLKWMTGQTCVKEGVYLTDLERYLRDRAKGVKNPYVWD